MNTKCKFQLAFLHVSICCGFMLPVVSMSASLETAPPNGSISTLPATGETKEESTSKHAPVTGLSRTTEVVEHREGSEPNGSQLSTTTLPPNSSVRQPASTKLPNPSPDSAASPAGGILLKDIRNPADLNQQQTIDTSRNAAKPRQRFKVLHDFNDAAVLDRKTGLVWERSPSANGYMFSGAIRHCQELATGIHRGFRLPDKEQLLSLVDPTQTNPALPSGHPFKNVSSSFWSSDISKVGPDTMAGGVDFTTGKSFGFFGVPTSAGTMSRAWCVRWGVGGNVDRFVDSGMEPFGLASKPPPARFEVLTNYNDKAVLDKSTGLVWERSPSTDTFKKEDADTHCQNLTLGNHGGWALAHTLEMESLIAYARSNPALPDGNPFVNVPYSLPFWSTDVDAPNTYHWVSFANGDDNSGPNNGYSWHAWCVRSGM
jgi:Protein of unknown function (DUF1566)